MSIFFWTIWNLPGSAIANFFLNHSITTCLVPEFLWGHVCFEMLQIHICSYFSLFNWVFHMYGATSWCAPSAKVRGSNWNFGILGFLGRSKYFRFPGCFSYERGYIFLGEVSWFSVHFPILKCKISKIKKFSLRHPHFQYSNFQI